MKKLCKIHMLPTDSGKNAIITNNGSVKTEFEYFPGQMLTQSYLKHCGKESNHIYVTSGDEIKVGDWFIDTDKNCIEKWNVGFANPYDGESCFKIISTTNPKLELPGVSKWFIELFCEKGGIWEVLVEYIPHAITDGGYKVSTTEVKTIYLPKLIDNTIVISEVKEKMYSESFVLWYSGMDKQKIENAHKRWLNEKSRIKNETE